MKSRLFFRESGYVIKTHHPLLDWLRTLALALLVALAVLVLPALVDPPEADDEPAAAVPMAEHLAALEAERETLRQEWAQMVAEAWRQGSMAGAEAQALRCAKGQRL